MNAPPLRIVLAQPRGFCAGVERAIEIVECALERFGPPILLIIDLSLTRRDGFAVIEGLRANRWARTEVIAWAAFRERDAGSIELGKSADLVLLERNLFDLAPHEISETQFVATWFEGRLVCSAPAAAKPQ